MSAPKPDPKDMRTVKDGRIRKGWPFARFGGPLRNNLRSAESKTKGLRNPGLLCYRNSVLQYLLHVPEFFRFLDKADRCPTPGDGCVFCALRSFALQYWTSAEDGGRESAVTRVNTAMENYPALNPDDDQRYGFLLPNMRTSGQQDAHEYFLGIKNMLEHHQDPVVKEQREYAINRLFALEVDITWKCVDCGKTHVKKQSETSIHLPLSRVVKTPDGEYHEQRLRSLDACFQQEFADADGEGVACDSQACNKKKGDRIRKTKITSGPEILVIHLVRMASDLEGNTRKLKHRIEYGERLDLGEWSVGPLKYQLNGIVAHQGPNLTQGHYVSMVRCQNGADFAECNDNSILDEPREKASILGRAESKAYQSYMLVYQKIGGKMAESLDPEKKESK